MLGKSSGTLGQLGRRGEGRAYLTMVLRLLETRRPPQFSELLQSASRLHKRE